MYYYFDGSRTESSFKDFALNKYVLGRRDSCTRYQNAEGHKVPSKPMLLTILYEV